MSAPTKMQTNQKPRPQITGRERQRISEKNRKRRIRRKRLVIFSFTFIVLVILTALTYAFFAIFKITSYTVEGSNTYTAEQIYESSGLLLGKNMLLSNVKSAEELLEKKLPYIGSAEIKRGLPSKLKYILTETKAACAIENDSGVLIIDKDGKILEQKAENSTGDLPVLKCPTPESMKIGENIEFSSEDKSAVAGSALEIYKNLLTAIQCSGINDITAIDMTDINDVWLVYQDRIKLHFGTPTKLESRLAFAAPVIASHISPTEKGEIDLTILGEAFFLPSAES